MCWTSCFWFLSSNSLGPYRLAARPDRRSLHLKSSSGDAGWQPNHLLSHILCAFAGTPAAAPGRNQALRPDSCSAGGQQCSAALATDTNQQGGTTPASQPVRRNTKRRPPAPQSWRRVHASGQPRQPRRRRRFSKRICRASRGGRQEAKSTRLVGMWISK